MKTFLPVTLVCCLLAACSSNDSDKENKRGSETSKNEKKNISKRDRSINASNSYSDLFFDSTAMEQFIQKKRSLIPLPTVFAVFTIPVITSMHGSAVMV